MFAKLNHQKLDIYGVSKQFVLECYRLTKNLPIEEKFGMITQIRRAALSVHLNIAEGSSRKSEAERKRYYEVGRGSVIEIDAALDMPGSILNKSTGTKFKGHVSKSCEHNGSIVNGQW